MMIFEELDKSEILNKYKSSFHEKARYFNVKKHDIYICIYGLINYTDKICECFWIMNSFKGKVFTKDFFIELFKHAFSLGYKEMYTWTEEPKIIKLFNRFGNFGIEKSDKPLWDMDDKKTWFIKRF